MTVQLDTTSHAQESQGLDRQGVGLPAAQTWRLLPTLTTGRGLDAMLRTADRTCGRLPCALPGPSPAWSISRYRLSAASLVSWLEMCVPDPRLSA